MKNSNAHWTDASPRFTEACLTLRNLRVQPFRWARSKLHLICAGVLPRTS